MKRPHWALGTAAAVVLVSVGVVLFGCDRQRVRQDAADESPESAALAGPIADLGEALAGSAIGTFERRIAVQGTVVLDVRAGPGSIGIRRGADNEVRITGHITPTPRFRSDARASARVASIEADPPISQSGATIRVGEVGDRGLHLKIGYELAVPASARVLTRTGSGSMRIEAILGPIDAQSNSGNVRISDAGGVVSVTTGSGAIEVASARQGLVARTGSGSVSVQAVEGRVEARSGSGLISVEFTGSGEGEFSTESGRIHVAGVTGALRVRAGSGSVEVNARPSGDWLLETGSGDISLILPPDAAFELNARTKSGSIGTSHPVEVSAPASPQRLKGQVRGGGPQLRLSASSGSIRID